MKGETERDVNHQENTGTAGQMEEDGGDADLHLQLDDLNTEDNPGNASNTEQAGNLIQSVGVACAKADTDLENGLPRDGEVAHNATHEGKSPEQGGGKGDLDAPENLAHDKDKAGDEIREEAEGANSGLESDSEESFVWKDDMGELRSWDIAHALVDDSLDEHCKALLIEGFERLLARE